VPDLAHALVWEKGGGELRKGRTESTGGGEEWVLRKERETKRGNHLTGLMTGHLKHRDSRERTKGSLYYKVEMPTGGGAVVDKGKKEPLLLRLRASIEGRRGGGLRMFGKMGIAKGAHSGFFEEGGRPMYAFGKSEYSRGETVQTGSDGGVWEHGAGKEGKKADMSR